MRRLSESELRDLLLRKNQPERSDVLLGIANDFGFSYRDAKGSHIFITHPHYSEIKGFNIKAPSSVRSHEDLMRACLKVLELESRDASLLLEEAFVAAVQETQLTFPKNYEIIAGRKITGLFLRNKQYPQIAVRLTDDEELKQSYLDQQVEILKKSVEHFSKVLSDGQYEGLDIQRLPSGTLKISHPFIETQMIPAFMPRNEGLPYFFDDGFIQNLESQVDDLRFQRNIAEAYLESVIEFYSLEFIAEDGVETQDRRYSCPQFAKSPNKKIFSVETFGVNWVSFDAVQKLDEACYEFAFSEYRQRLKLTLGLVFEDVDDGGVALSHPLFTNVISLPPLRVGDVAALSAPNDLKEDERQGYGEMLFDVLNKRQQRLNLYKNNVALFQQSMVSLARKSEYELACMGLECLPMRPEQFTGELIDIGIVSKTDVSAQQVSVKALGLRHGKNTISAILPPASLEYLRLNPPGLPKADIPEGLVISTKPILGFP